MNEHNPRDVFTMEQNDSVLIMVTGGEPYLWVGDGRGPGLHRRAK
jgi:hypothetical protein